MSDWRTLLHELDGDQSPMDAEKAREIRRRMMEMAASASPAASLWPLRLAFACVALAFVTFGAGQNQMVNQSLDPSTNTTTGSEERRQIQFSTPGGTKIIWELNPDFTLRETLP